MGDGIKEKVRKEQREKTQFGGRGGDYREHPDEDGRRTR